MRLLPRVMAVVFVASAATCVCAQTQTDAISREITAYIDDSSYAPITDAVGREFTVYVGTQPLREQTDCVTREFTAFVDPVGGGSNFITDAITREFTVYVGTQPLRAQTDAVSREFTAYVDAATFPPITDAVSREFTAYIGTQPLREQTDCISREFTTFVGEYLTCPSWTHLSHGPLVNGFGFAYDEQRRVAVLFGGFDDGFFFPDAFDETHEWDGVQWQFRNVPGPAARGNLAMAYDAVRHNVVLFGGLDYNVTDTYADTWTWNGNAWTQRFPFVSPPARFGHVMAYDSARGVVVLFGGVGATGALADTWEWNGANWTQRAVSGPPARSFAAGAYDASRSVLVLFGGYNGHLSLGDTWEFDGNAWALRANTGPSPRNGSAMAFVDIDDVCVLHGGANGGGVFNGTWTWDGADWRLQSVPNPVALVDHGLVPTAAPGYLTAHGGQYDDFFGLTNADDTYRVHIGLLSVAIVLPPVSQTVRIGDTVSFSTAASGTAPLTYRWRKDGQNLVNGPAPGGGTLSGATTETLTITNVGAADAGVYDVVVTNQCNSVDSADATLTVNAFPRGDMNCDGVVNNFDIDPFVLALTNAAGYAAAYPNCNINNGDINRDGAVNNFDIDPFVLCLTSGCP